jgi:hypothetical protein
MLTYAELENKPRELLAATSLNKEEFEALLEVFSACYRSHQSSDYTQQGQKRQRRTGGGRSSKLQTVADKLLFILMYEKTYPLQSMHGLQFGLSQGQVNYWIQRLMPLLEQALTEMGHAPERVGIAVADSPLAQPAGGDLLIDGTERRRQRPQEATAQKEHYSGKKNAHP